MKTMTKKLGSIVLALCLCLSLCCTAFAASGNVGSITINNAAEGETYTIYQIFDLTYTSDEANQPTDGASYSYKVVEAWKTFITNYTYENESGEIVNLFKLTSDGYLDPESAIFSEQDDSDVMVEFARAALEYATENKIGNSGSETAGASGEVEFSDLALGYYLVDTSLGSLCFLDSTNPAATIEEKNPTPTITKEIYEDDYARKDEDIEHDDNNGHFEENVDGDGWGTWDDADNTQTIIYHLTLEDIRGALNLTVHDYLEEGLDFTKIESIILYADKNDEEGTVLESGVDYVLTQSDCSDPYCEMDGCTFEIHFVSEDEESAYHNLTRLFDNLSSEAYIVITYDAETDTHADDYEDYFDSILNHAYLAYGTSSRTPVETTETDLFGFGVFKYTGENQTPLEGAKFILSKGTDEDEVFAVFETELDEETNTYYYILTEWVYDVRGATELESGTDGMIRIEGLDDDTYYLQETEAPEGYNLLSDTIVVVIDENGGITVNGEGATKDSTITHQVNVENKSGTELPGTGGIGTTIFYIIGGVLVAGAVVVLITRRRMSHEA